MTALSYIQGDAYGPCIQSFMEDGFVEQYAHGAHTSVYVKRIWTEDEGHPYKFVDLVKIPAGSEIGFHVHGMDNQELYIVLSGKGAMRVDGECVEVFAGCLIVNPPGGGHALQNSGAEEMWLVVIEVGVSI